MFMNWMNSITVSVTKFAVEAMSVSILAGTT